ncbi:DUF3343 domain-containing protein [Geosporobacter subterraneus]|uniref:DUF3343 domain-containing protein n=1 Tax=Geosporobacter subterraneus TaxID=390806 RepID=UPI000DA61782
MEYLATFFTHSGAIKYQKLLRNQGCSVDLMPVPRKVSSNCGVAAKFNYENKIQTIISDDIECLYIVEEKAYKLLYKAGEE